MKTILNVFTKIAIVISVYSYLTVAVVEAFGLKLHDLNVVILKSIAFGFTIALVSCVSGMRAKDGAKGVGVATTKAVVWSFVSIVLIDLIFAAVFFY